MKEKLKHSVQESIKWAFEPSEKEEHWSRIRAVINALEMVEASLWQEIKAEQDRGERGAVAVKAP